VWHNSTGKLVFIIDIIVNKGEEMIYYEVMQNIHMEGIIHISPPINGGS